MKSLKRYDESANYGAAMQPLRSALERRLLSIRGVDRTLRVP